jgi:hypothetical protein
MKKVKGEGEKALPISLSYINTNSSCNLFSYDKSVVTLLSPSLFTPCGSPDRAGTPKAGKISVRPNKSPWGQAKIGRWGWGFFRLPPAGIRDPWEVVRAASGALVYPPPIAFLRGAGAVLGAIWKGYRPQAGAFEPNPIPVPRTDHPLIPFRDIRHRHAVNNLVASGHHRGRCQALRVAEARHAPRGG